MRQTLRRWLPNLLLLLASTVVGALLVELALRALLPPSPLSPTLPLRPHVRIQITPNTPGISERGVFSTNRWGLRGEEPPDDWAGTYTVLTVGGSTTRCFLLDDQKTWPHLVQERLRAAAGPRVWVGNAGLDGHTTRAHLLFMRDAIRKVRPNAVVMLVGVNDLALSLNDETLVYGNPFEAISWKHRALAASRLGQVLYAWKLVLFEEVYQYERDGRPFTTEPLSQPEPERNDRELAAQLPEYRANLARIVADARSLGVPLYLVTQPLRFEDNAYWRTRLGRLGWLRKTAVPLSAATYWRLLDLYNRETLETCRSTGTPCIDLASALPHDGAFFYDAAHFNEEGARRVADHVSAALLPALRARPPR